MLTPTRVRELRDTLLTEMGFDPSFDRIDLLKPLRRDAIYALNNLAIDLALEAAELADREMERRDDEAAAWEESVARSLRVGREVL